MNKLAYDSNRGPAQRYTKADGTTAYRPWSGPIGGAWKRSGRKIKPASKLDKAPTSTGRIPWRRFSKCVSKAGRERSVRA